MSTTYRGSPDRLALALLILLSLCCPLAVAAQTTGARVGIDPPQVAVDPQATFSVAVTVADAPELRSYEFALTFDPAVVEVEAVEQGSFLEGQSPVDLGPAIDNEAGMVTFGALGMGSGPWPSGAGELATLTLKAVGEGATVLDLRDVQLFGSGDGDAIVAAVEDGRVQVGDETLPTDTPTTETPATATSTPTDAATAVETATPPPEATATKTPTGGATTPPESTATGTPTSGATEPDLTVTSTATDTAALTGEATEPPREAATPVDEATKAPTVGGTPGGGATSTAPGGPTPPGAASPSATAEPAEGENAEPTATSGEEPAEGDSLSGLSPWLAALAVVLGLAGIALIGWGIFTFGLGRRRDEEPMDDDTA